MSIAAIDYFKIAEACVGEKMSWLMCEEGELGLLRVLPGRLPGIGRQGLDFGNLCSSWRDRSWQKRGSLTFEPWGISGHQLRAEKRSECGFHVHGARPLL